MVELGELLHQAVINVQGKTRATRKQMNDSAIATQVDVQRCNLPNGVGNFTQCGKPPRACRLRLFDSNGDVHNAKGVQKPEAQHQDYDDIQDGLDRLGHGDIGVD